MSSVKEIIEKVNNGNASEEEKGALLSIRRCDIYEENIKPEYAFTLSEWDNISDTSVEVSDEKFVEIFPHLERLV